MEDTNQIYRELGSMDARIGNIEKTVASLESKVDTLLERSAKDAGGNSALWKVGGSGVGVGGLIVAVLQWLGTAAPALPPPRAPAAIVQTTPPAGP